MTIITAPGEIYPHLYLFDTLQFTKPRITTSFAYWDGTTCILLDVGTSNNIHQLKKNLKRFQIPIEKVQGILLTHYHFDHAGGVHKLWRKISKTNPNFRIFTTAATQQKLQNAADHVIGAKTTFGEFVGTMPALTHEEAQCAYFIIEHDTVIPFTLDDGYEFKLIATPGHSPDHSSPLLLHNGKPIFLFCGEASGTLYNGQELLSMPTSMPPNFQYEIYDQSLDKMRHIQPEIIGICHFGAVSGKEATIKFLTDHQAYMKDFRQTIITAFAENPSTRHVITRLKETNLGLESRVGNFYKDHTDSQYFQNLFLAVTFGVLVDLKFRKSKYETPEKE
jgi:glyoxylase-like metal-dependent hydrolase (beta-lactamase superfamily II)